MINSWLSPLLKNQSVIFYILLGWTSCCVLQNTTAPYLTGIPPMILTQLLFYKQVFFLFDDFLSSQNFINFQSRFMMRWVCQTVFWGFSQKEDMVIITGIPLRLLTSLKSVTPILYALSNGWSFNFFFVFLAELRMWWSI